MFSSLILCLVFLTACTVEIGIGFDVSRAGASSQSLVSSQPMLRAYLPEIVKHISTLHNLCCLNTPTLQTKTAFLLVASDGRELYSTNFEAFSDAVIGKVMAHTISQGTAFNSQLLQSFQAKFATSNAGVKVSHITDNISSHEACRFSYWELYTICPSVCSQRFLLRSRVFEYFWTHSV